MALTAKQKLFADVYNGNTTEAAKIAGMSRGYAARLMLDITKHNIEPAAAAVQERIKARNEEKGEHSAILSRKERQELWSKWTKGKEKPTTEQLKASELLGKSELDFNEKGVDAATAIVVQINTPAVIAAPQTPSKALNPVEGTIIAPIAAKDLSKEDHV